VINHNHNTALCVIYHGPFKLRNPVVRTWKNICSAICGHCSILGSLINEFIIVTLDIIPCPTELEPQSSWLGRLDRQVNLWGAIVDHYFGARWQVYTASGRKQAKWETYGAHTWTPPVCFWERKGPEALASLVGHSMMGDSGFGNNNTVVLGVYHHMTLKHETNFVDVGITWSGGSLQKPALHQSWQFAWKEAFLIYSNTANGDPHFGPYPKFYIL
jgi:hypothetical protein